MDRKARHEQFVTGFTGGSLWEVYGVSFVCLLALITHHFVSKSVSPGFPSFLADFLFNWASVLASVTIYANRLWTLGIIIGATALLSYTSTRSSSASAATAAPPTKTSKSTARSGPKNADTKKLKASKQQSKEPAVTLVAYRPFLTLYRSAMMVLTITAILVVDFPIFPRRFAKTETWGTSLMDLGVGSFVFSMGIISVRTRMKNPSLPFRDELKASIIQTSKVLALGFIRLFSVKYLDYQEHVSEYGVHWNFFFTLGFLPFAFTLVSRIPFPGRTLGKAIALGLSHELLLKNTGLQEWALSAPRVSLISQNKEGIVSFLGYLAIFQFGYSLGVIIISPKTTMKQIVVKCTLWAIVSQAVFSVLTIATEPSRRIANLPYIVWVVAFNAGFLALAALAEYTLGVQPSKSYVSVNTFGESVFILANVGTGLINLSMDTLTMDRGLSIAVLLGYQLVAMGAVNYLYARKLRATVSQTKA